MIDEKPWYLSKTIWGSLVAVFAALSASLGFPLDAVTQTELSDIAVQLVGAAGALLAIYGRLTATRIIS